MATVNTTSEVIGTLTVNENPYNRAEIIRKKDQNQLSGIAWQAAGNVLCFAALAATAALAYQAGGAALSAAGMMSSDSFYVPRSVLEMGLIYGGALIADVVFIKGVAECFTNAMYHLGPHTEIRYEPQRLHERNYTPIAQQAAVAQRRVYS